MLLAIRVWIGAHPSDSLRVDLTLAGTRSVCATPRVTSTSCLNDTRISMTFARCAQLLLRALRLLVGRRGPHVQFMTIWSVRRITVRLQRLAAKRGTRNVVDLATSGFPKKTLMDSSSQKYAAAARLNVDPPGCLARLHWGLLAGPDTAVMRARPPAVVQSHNHEAPAGVVCMAPNSL